MGGRGARAYGRSPGTGTGGGSMGNLNEKRLQYGGKLDDKMVSNINSVQTNLMYQFPELRNMGDIMVFNTNSRSLSNAYAFVYGGGDAVHVNEKYFSDRENLYKTYANDVKAGFHPKGTDAGDIVAHEFGHVAHNMIVQKYRGSSTFMNAKVKSGEDIINTIVRRANTNANKTTGKTEKLTTRVKQISHYAERNNHETIAEAFADVYANGSRANALSTEIVKIIRKELA